jgi:signal peptidase II
LGLGIALTIVAADQASKIWALELLFDPPRAVEVTSFFNLVAVWNSGVSFGFLAGYSDTMPYILTGFAAAVVAGMSIWLMRTRVMLVAIALGLIIGGALGNIVDRLRFKAVIDFIDLHVAGYHWPAFNLADSAITVGVGLLLLDGLLRREE